MVKSQHENENESVVSGSGFTGGAIRLFYREPDRVVLAGTSNGRKIAGRAFQANFWCNPSLEPSMSAYYSCSNVENEILLGKDFVL